MDKVYSKKICAFVLAGGAVLLPHVVSASQVYLEPTRSQFFVGDTVLIDVKVDSEGKKINTVEGVVLLDYAPNTVAIKDINVSGSSFSLWPHKPSLLDDLKTISFVGGVPNGLTHQGATLFKIALELKEAGQITLNPTDVSVYIHDGKGTKDITSTRNLTLEVRPQEAGRTPVNELGVLISDDTTPPQRFEILAGQDDAIFDGKRFLSFSTTDGQSGIKYYEVREGNLPPVRSSGTYVLQNQDTPTRVTIVAYDAAGNAREAVYDPAYSYLPLAIVGALVLLLLAVLTFIVVKRRKKR